jgi:hypothetical protein
VEDFPNGGELVFARRNAIGVILHPQSAIVPCPWFHWCEQVLLLGMRFRIKVRYIFWLLLFTAKLSNYVHALARKLRSKPDLDSPDAERDRYTRDVVGLPILFSVRGSHSHKYTHWSFPDPSKYVQFSQLDDITFRKVCIRFEFVRQDLENALIKEVQLRTEDLLRVEDESDSSGLSYRKVRGPKRRDSEGNILMSEGFFVLDLVQIRLRLVLRGDSGYYSSTLDAMDVKSSIKCIVNLPAETRNLGGVGTTIILELSLEHRLTQLCLVPLWQ